MPMKKSLLLFILSSLAQIGFSQNVVFCHKGAEWSYVFTDYYPRWGFVNEKVKYVSDTIVGVDTLKILSHTKFFTQINFGGTKHTYIKQKGDTVFMKNNRTLNKWQILYNYAAMPGQSWTNTLLVAAVSSSISATYTTLVMAVSNTVINNQSLKELTVSNSTSYGPFYTRTTKITERIGSSVFLFNYYARAASDGDYYAGFLCYSDTAFNQQFTDKPCDFSNMMGISDIDRTESLIETYPNPAYEWIKIDLKSLGSEQHNTELKITNALGQLIKTQIIENENSEITVSVEDLANGVYLITLNSNNQVTSGKRIVINR